MLRDVESVEVAGDHELRLRFDDGVEGVVDVSKLTRFEGIMAPLASSEYFARVEVNHELGTVVWPNGVDLDPIVLYSAATGKPLPEWSRDLAPV